MKLLLSQVARTGAAKQVTTTIANAGKKLIPLSQHRGPLLQLDKKSATLIKNAKNRINRDMYRVGNLEAKMRDTATSPQEISDLRWQVEKLMKEISEEQAAIREIKAGRYQQQLQSLSSDPIVVNGRKLVPLHSFQGPTLQLDAQSQKLIASAQNRIRVTNFRIQKLEDEMRDQLTSPARVKELYAEIQKLNKEITDEVANIRNIKIERYQEQLALNV
jgi:hypothetical protein